MKQVLKEACVLFYGWEDVLDSATTDHPIITTLHGESSKNIPSRLIPILAEQDFLLKGGSKQS
ncbi:MULTISPECIES: hypothetical protein [Lysinibacillus]|uniref:hypothetical protein n=1 Tax=Lysinibacillus TaxID=400634 RepID=UPI0004DAA3C4|nr:MULTISPECIES: hypothetical protein [Lysinibacillus]AJK88502.1 hypothetical protein HR49_15855 [Lysinibacillus fusiformis]KHK53983.1 hypothetical protein PI85_07140 [Lysinibacillus sp. A1]MEE3809873.1 hypothetical protein [Lysinibacillus fusiformis]